MKLFLIFGMSILLVPLDDRLSAVAANHSTVRRFLYIDQSQPLAV